jgi:hypothetical protein
LGSNWLWKSPGWELITLLRTIVLLRQLLHMQHGFPHHRLFAFPSGCGHKSRPLGLASTPVDVFTTLRCFANFQLLQNFKQRFARDF